MDTGGGAPTLDELQRFNVLDAGARGGLGDDDGGGGGSGGAVERLRSLAAPRRPVRPPRVNDRVRVFAGELAGLKGVVLGVTDGAVRIRGSTPNGIMDVTEQLENVVKLFYVGDKIKVRLCLCVGAGGGGVLTRRGARRRS